MSGLEQTRPKHGGNLIWAAKLAGCPPANILDFSASINPLGPPLEVMKAITDSLGELAGYPDPNYTHLREVVASYHNLSPDWVLPGNGVAELLTWACRDLAQGQVTYLCAPAFGDYQRSLNAFKAETQFWLLPLFKPGEANCTVIDRTHEQILPDSASNLTSWLKSSGVWQGGILNHDQVHLPLVNSELGLLLNNPHNPTGILFPANIIRPYLEANWLVIVDEAFMDFVAAETFSDTQSELYSVVQWVMEFPNLVVLRSLTKFYSLPGLRLGYALAHPDRLRRWQHWRDPWPVNTLAAVALETALAEHGFRHQTLTWLGPTRLQLFKELNQIPGLKPLPAVANFLLVRSEFSVSALQAALLKRFQILIRDCLSFPALGDQFFRVAVRTEAENQKLVEGLTQVIKDGLQAN